jgi:hypothetical protein
MNDHIHVPDERCYPKKKSARWNGYLAISGPMCRSTGRKSPELRVVSRCACGCPTIDFAIGPTRKGGPSHIIADAEGSSPEEVRVGVIAHVREGEISELEVYPASGEKNAFSLPRAGSLVRWPD